MKTFHYLAASAAVLLSFGAVSCSEKNEPEVIVNHIYLTSPNGATSVTAGTDEEVEVAVTLSFAPSTSVTLDFAAEGEAASYVTLSGTPVTIEYGTAVSSFTVKAAEGVSLESPVSVTITAKNLDERKFDVLQTITITVMPASGSNLSPEDKALVDAWKSKYNIDLTPWLGTVSLSGELEYPGSGNREPFVAPANIPLAGASIFAISSEADNDTPVLDIIENPMGMKDYLLTTFLQFTINDKEYFTQEEDGGQALMKLISWDSASSETFEVTLPGLRITDIKDGKATVEFVVEGENFILNSNGEPIYSEEMESDLVYNFAESRIPFTYQYSAWARQLALVEEGDATAIELLTYGVSAAPASYLGVTGVLEDEWEIDEEEDGVANLYVEPKGEIDFNKGTMTFEFPFDHEDQTGYSRVRVVYSINK